MSTVIHKVAAVNGKSLTGTGHKKCDDRFLIKSLNRENILLAVSDGMGGHPAGDMASEDIIASLNSVGSKTGTEFGTSSIVSAIDSADAAIRNRVRKSLILEGMGATVTAVILNRRKLWWGHVGDSRLYLMRGGSLRRITRDHSFLQDFIDSGELSEEEAAAHPMAHVLDQCVGGLDVGADCGSFSLSPGDFLLLCTDGLHRVVPDVQIASTISSTKDVTGCVDKLLRAAQDQGLPDDTTIIVAHLLETDR